MRQGKKKPLYRKVNTTAHGVNHGDGGDYRDQRRRGQRDDLTAQSMGARERRGLDYTPLFRFLLSKVGSDWDAVHSEAMGRLDREDPIHWMVDLHCISESTSYFGTGESTYWSQLFVDEHNLLQVKDPSVTHASLQPSCKCCTHTFNGVPFARKFDPECGRG